MTHYAAHVGDCRTEADGTCVVRCKCGVEAVGTHFGAVGAPHNPNDAWQIFRWHIDNACRRTHALPFTVYSL